MKKITKQQWLGLIRHLLSFIGGILITQGIIDEMVYTEISGALITVVAGIWSIIEKSQQIEE